MEDAAAASRPVVLAAVAGAHGVRGEVRLRIFASSADSLRRHRHFNAGGRQLLLQDLRVGSSGAIARFDGITDRSAAEALRGTLLSVPRQSLPPLAAGEYYWHDLIGRSVAGSDGVIVGRVTAVDNYGASDILEVTRDDGSSVLVPFVPEAVTDDGRLLAVGSEWLQ